LCTSFGIKFGCLTDSHTVTRKVVFFVRFFIAHFTHLALHAYFKPSSGQPCNTAKLATVGHDLHRHARQVKETICRLTQSLPSRPGCQPGIKHMLAVMLHRTNPEVTIWENVSRLLIEHRQRVSNNALCSTVRHSTTLAGIVML
jgi:hypothetical protein